MPKLKTQERAAEQAAMRLSVRQALEGRQPGELVGVRSMAHNICGDRWDYDKKRTLLFVGPLKDVLRGWPDIVLSPCVIFVEHRHLEPSHDSSLKAEEWKTMLPFPTRAVTMQNIRYKGPKGELMVTVSDRRYVTGGGPGPGTDGRADIRGPPEILLGEKLLEVVGSRFWQMGVGFPVAIGGLESYLDRCSGGGDADHVAANAAREVRDALQDLARDLRNTGTKA